MDRQKTKASGRAGLCNDTQETATTAAHLSAERIETQSPTGADRQPALSGFSAGDADGAILFRPSAERPHALADARWFAAHPERSHCFRRAANDEAPAAFVLVRQIKPGVRLRLAVALDDDTLAPALLSANDDVLHVAADLLLAQRRAEPGDVLREVARRRGCGGHA